MKFDINHIGDRPKPQSSTRPFARFGAVVLSALVAAALWLPTVTVPADHSQLAATPVAVELA